MAFPSIVGRENQIRAVWKWSLSLFQRDWTLSDYPISIREQAIDPAYASTRLKQHRYSATIVNWWVISGSGNNLVFAHDDGLPCRRIGTTAQTVWAVQAWR